MKQGMEQNCQSCQVNGVKARGQLRLAVNGVLSPFNCYGMNVFVKMAAEQVVELAEKYHQRMMGEDIPIAVNGSYAPEMMNDAI